MVVGGPPIKMTPNVKWSDPEGLRPEGGRWEVYSQKNTGRTRLRLTLIMSTEKQQQLELDGVVMMVDSWNGEKGMQEQQAQVFGGTWKRMRDKVDDTPGDFSMTKIVTEDDQLFATVGSQQQRMW